MLGDSDKGMMQYTSGVGMGLLSQQRGEGTCSEILTERSLPCELFIFMPCNTFVRFLQRQVLKVWSGYIPVAKEERAKELRRAELRRKVSSWLSDFQPPPPEVS